MAPPTSSRRPWTISRAGAALARSGSATAPPTSCSSTSTARRWTRFTWPTLTACKLASMTDWLCEHWDQPDEGIWETRGGQRDSTYARYQTWIALDRAIRLATRRARPADVARWTTTRDQV